ncbi:hypothetical protein EDB85DRAFT_152379 [Lactarius pseudohatsudake]|nr:hypothetical protein EDB85DRAFT_152379 [Lactarius pseudohatsudake]
MLSRVLAIIADRLTRRARLRACSAAVVAAEALRLILCYAGCRSSENCVAFHRASCRVIYKRYNQCATSFAICRWHMNRRATVARSHHVCARGCLRDAAPATLALFLRRCCHAWRRGTGKHGQRLGTVSRKSTRDAGTCASVAQLLSSLRKGVACMDCTVIEVDLRHLRTSPREL